jgi:IS30 family transposase
MSYHHLTIEERACIQLFFQKGMGPTEIAKELNRDKSSISRELRRNASRDEGYNAVGAQRKYNARRRQCVRKAIILSNKILFDKICERLRNYWSPEQISNTLPKKMKVCFSTIYRAIKNKDIPKEYCVKLRRYGKHLKRGKSNGRAYDFSQVRTIDQRPKSINNRSRYGHWELDTLVLRPEAKCHLATFVERKSRLVFIRKIPDKKASTMSDIIINVFNSLPRKYLKTFTVDRGLEFTDWKRVEKELKVKVYFCDPYSPQQRGSNENTNGLIRQFVPRRTILPDITDDFVDTVQTLINNRPRKCLNWKTPLLHFS